MAKIQRSEGPKKAKRSSVINFQPEEAQELRDIKNDSSDPNAYKNAVQKKIGFTPKKYPAGSEASNEQSKKYDTAVGLVNDGFRPITKTKNGKTSEGYRKVYDSEGKIDKSASEESSENETSSKMKEAIDGPKSTSSKYSKLNSYSEKKNATESAIRSASMKNVDGSKGSVAITPINNKEILPKKKVKRY